MYKIFTNKVLWGNLLAIVIAFAILITLNKTTDLFKSPTLTPGGAREAVVCPPQFANFDYLMGGAGQVVELIPETKRMSAADKFINSEIVIVKTETKKSKVACGYLFVRAGTEEYGAIQSWEDIYINPNEFGGHLDQSSAITVNDRRKEYSEYLYSLDEIQYWPRKEDKNRKILTADWAALLNVSPEVNFHIALNTTADGFINKVLIAYKCWDPATGEENKNCKLDVDWEKSQDIEVSQPVLGE